MAERKVYSSIDLMKFLSAFLVIGIHTSPFELTSSFIDYGFSILTRIAVPFFFVSSAFLYFSKENSLKRTIKYCKRILSLYFVWSALYMLFGFINAGYFDKEILFEFFETFAIQGYKHLWFLWAIFIAMLIVSIFDLYVKNDFIIYTVSLVLYSVGLVMSTYAGLLFKIEGFEQIYNFVSFNIGFRNGLVYGLPFVLMGRYFAITDKKININKSVLGMVISFIALAAESFFVIKIITTKDTILWISTLPILFFLFSLVLNIEIKENKILFFMRKSSVLMYCIHPMIITLLSGKISNNFVLFTVVSILSVFISFIVYELSNSKFFKFLKYIQ